MLALAVPPDCALAPLRGPALSLSEGSVDTGMTGLATGAQGYCLSLLESCRGLDLRKRRRTEE